MCVSQDLNKRLSLPADIRIPDDYLEKLQLSSPPFDQPLSRRSRRASLVSVHMSVFIALQRCYHTPSVQVTMATGPPCDQDRVIWSLKSSPPAFHSLN